MKKILLVGALAFIGLASCKKDYTCECKDSTGAVVSSSTVTGTKKAAKAACEGNVLVSSGCELK